MAAHCPECGQPTSKREIEGRLLDVCPACGHIAWRNPVVATMVLVTTPGGVLLGRRTIDPGLGRWCLPGGFVNADEHPRAAAARECQEELVAPVEVGELRGVYHVIRGDGSGMIVLAYLGRLAEGASPEAGNEMSEIGVFAADRLPDLAFDSHRQAIADWAAGRAAL